MALIVGDIKTCHAILGDDNFYLSEIVNNKLCQIDVDKWDYMLRDSHYVQHITRIRPNFDRCFLRAKVVRRSPTDRTHIGYHHTTYPNICDLFENRSLLHQNVYQNENVIATELLLDKIFKLADDNGFLFKG